jgi:hypothetical protein
VDGAEITRGGYFTRINGQHAVLCGKGFRCEEQGRTFVFRSIALFFAAPLVSRVAGCGAESNGLVCRETLSWSKNFGPHESSRWVVENIELFARLEE